MISTCRLCGSGGLTLYYTEGNDRQFRYYRCPHCGLVNYDLSGGVDQEKHTERFVDPRDAGHRVNVGTRQTYEFVKRHVRPPGTMLDIGCHNGSLLLCAREDGWTVRGLELFEFLARSVTEATGIEVAVCDFLQYEVPPGEAYDVVVLRHVLEHLPDSMLAMRKINALVKPDGLAVLEFPNTDSLSLRLKWFLGRQGLRRKRWPPEYVPHHANEFGRKAFEYLTGKTGFRTVKWESYSSRPGLTPLYRALGIGNKVRVIVRKTAPP